MKRNVVERQIMWGDLDSLGIVFYPRYYEWFDGCSHLFFEAIDLNCGNLLHQRKIAFGLAETSCRYFKPARYHQKIHIVTGIDALEEKTILLKHTISGPAGGVRLLEGLEKRICLDVSDPEHFRATNIPADIYEVLKAAKEQ